LKNLAIFTTPKKTMDFFEVTGVFRRASRSERTKLPHGYVAEKTNPGALASGREGLRPEGK
jgi:hypothetical protein